MSNELTKRVYVSADASMVVTLDCNDDESLALELRYGDPVACRFSAAAIVDSYDYLLSKNITTKEAIRRIRILRRADR